jgi:tetratricopeptide (TPR) repeat protein
MLVAVVVVGLGTALLVVTRRDAKYVSTTIYSDGSASVQTSGVQFRDASNREPYNRANAAIYREDYIGAEAVFREIIRRTPDELAAWHGLGNTLYHQRRFPESREAYERILRVEPHHYPARLGLGAVERSMGRYSDSVLQYSLALQEDGNSATAYYGRGVSQLFAGRRAEALADLSKVLELLPPNAALAMRAKEYMQRIENEMPAP